MKKRSMSTALVALLAGIANSSYAAEPKLVSLSALPEDIVAVPDSPWLIISGMNPGGNLKGGFYAMHQQTHEILALQPSFETSNRLNADCATPPDRVEPHGINVRTTENGLELLAVNHGNREAVERFALTIDSQPRLTWQGCFPLPPNIFANGVTGWHQDSILITSMFDPSDETSEKTMLAAKPIGGIWIGRRGADFERIEGIALAGANGVIADHDRNLIVAAAWTEKRVHTYRLGPDNTIAEHDSVDIPFLPDNLRWNDDKVLVTGQYSEPLNVKHCAIFNTTCSQGISVYQLDPKAQTLEHLVSGENWRYGDASVAEIHTGQVFIGNLQTPAVLVAPTAQ